MMKYWPDGSLDSNALKNFWKRLRKRYAPNKIRYFACGEYGENLQRPHYHACIFNLDFPDRSFLKQKNGINLYRSPALEKLWPFGFSSIGELTFDSAAYTARYCTKKITGLHQYNHYVNSDGVMLLPEFARWSLKPGLGEAWYQQYKDDCYPDDFIYVNDNKVNIPRYYDKLMEMEDPVRLEIVKQNRKKNSLRHAADNTQERLATREKVKIAQTQTLTRKFEDAHHDY